MDCLVEEIYKEIMIKSTSLSLTFNEASYSMASSTRQCTKILETQMKNILKEKA